MLPACSDSASCRYKQTSVGQYAKYGTWLAVFVVSYRHMCTHAQNPVGRHHWTVDDPESYIAAQECCRSVGGKSTAVASILSMPGSCTSWVCLQVSHSQLFTPLHAGC